MSDGSIPAERLRSRSRERPRSCAGASRALVSVVVPCYNYARYLPEAVMSALEQDGVAVEVVVVDDASTDGSATVAEALVRANPSVRLLRHETNAGPVETFNDGLSVAKGDFLVRLDADDILTPGALRRAVDLFMSYPSVGLVYGHPIHFSGSKRPRPRLRSIEWTLWPGQDWVAERCRSGLNVITSPEVVMRADVVARVGGQQPLAHTHDMEMWLRIAAFADVAYIVGADQAWHRDHAASLSARRVDFLCDIQGRLDAFEALLAGPAADVLDVDVLRASARHALACEALDFACHQYDRGRANEDESRALIEFVRHTYPSFECLKEWNGLQRRVASGPVSKRRHWAMLQAILRRLKRERRYRHWARWGVYSEHEGQLWQ